MRSGNLKEIPPEDDGLCVLTNLKLPSIQIGSGSVS